MKKLEDILSEVITQEAVETDLSGSFPKKSVQALMLEGYYGLLSSCDVGGGGKSLREISGVCEKIATVCSSTAMVTCMHYCGTVVLEKYGDLGIRSEIAKGNHLTTLAFSEAGSRSHFWAPISTASKNNDLIKLNAKKSWVTSANSADSYVWSSKPIEKEGLSSIFFVPKNTKGLNIDLPFIGLGMRGNESSPVTAVDAEIPNVNLLGEDGAGFNIMMGDVLPYFVVLNASVSIGIMKAALESAIKHVTTIKYDHLSQGISDLPTIRAYIAKAKVMLDAASTLRDDTVSAIESGREDQMLRILEVKAYASEVAMEVTDIAMRVCGGAAFRKELGVERNFRDSRAASVMAPTSDVLYDFIGKLSCGIPLF